MKILNEWGNSSFEEWYTVIKEQTINYKVTVEGHNEEIGLKYICYINKDKEGF